MKDLKRQLEMIAECLPESPFKETVKTVTAAAITEIERWRIQVEITAEQQCPSCCKSSPDDAKRIQGLQQVLRAICDNTIMPSTGDSSDSARIEAVHILRAKQALLAV